MPKRLSRAKRCAQAVAPLYGAISDLQTLGYSEQGIQDTEFKDYIVTLMSRIESDASAAYSELEILQEEMTDWYDSLNEGLQATNQGERIQEAADNLDTAKNYCQEAEGMAGSFEYESHSDFDEMEQSVDELISKLEEAANTAEETDFPGMFGR